MRVSDAAILSAWASREVSYHVLKETCPCRTQRRWMILLRVKHQLAQLLQLSQTCGNF